MKQLLPDNSSDNNGLPILRPEYAPMEPVASELPPAPPSFKLQKFLAFLLKYWPIPLVTLLIGAGGGYAYVRTMPPSFVSYALLVKPVAVQVGQGVFSEDPNFLGTQTELLQSSLLRHRTIDHLKAQTNDIPLEPDGQPMAVSIDVSASAKSSVYTVIGTSANPAYVQAYVDALVLEYLAYRGDARKLASSQSLASITEAELRYERELREKQEILAIYERTNNLFEVRDRARADASKLAEEEIKLADEEMDLQLNLRSVNDKRQNHFIVPTNSAAVVTGTNAGALVTAAPETQLLSLDKQIEALKYERAKRSINWRPNHPGIVVLDAEIARNTNFLALSDKQTDQQIAAAIEQLKSRIDERKKAIQRRRDTLKGESDLLSIAAGLERDVNQTLLYFQKLKSIEDQVQLGRTIEQDPLTTLQAAAPAYRSYAAETTMMTKCSLGGLFIGLAIVFLIALLNDEFASSHEVNERFGEVIVGQVPDIRLGPKKEPLALLQDNDDRHNYAESFRNLRSALFFLANDGARPKLILVTSAVPNEGKSTIAANLAKIMAVGGARVLLVDGDMRRGSLHKQYDLLQEPGFTDLLRQSDDLAVDLASFVQKSSVPNLDFIGRGGSVKNPGDLLLSSKVDHILETFRNGYQYVVIDSCPVFAADDVTTLAPRMDGALFVVRSKFSRAKVVKEALDLLYQRQARVLGLVFNRAKSSSRKDHYYNYAEYHTPK